MSLESTYSVSNYVCHNFDIYVATELKSVDQAIFLSHIMYWLEYNKRMKQNFHEGRYWTYDTLEKLHGHFPYWSVDQLRHIIKKLTDKGILIKGNFNETKYDRTIWYTIDFSKYPKCIWEISQMDVGEIPNRSGENPTPIPHNITHNITHRDIDIIARAREEEKIPIGKFVQLTQEEIDKFISDYGKSFFDDICERINDYCANYKQKGYKDYAAAFRNFAKSSESNKSNESNKATFKPKKGLQGKSISEMWNDQPPGNFINGIRVD